MSDIKGAIERRKKYEFVKKCIYYGKIYEVEKRKLLLDVRNYKPYVAKDKK
tara:strand:- start:320 stop:472 length:153 start_codon:yes stop_codon:yes gene_type:complete